MQLIEYHCNRCGTLNRIKVSELENSLSNFEHNPDNECFVCSQCEHLNPVSSTKVIVGTPVHSISNVLDVQFTGIINDLDLELMEGGLFFNEYFKKSR